VRRFHRRRGWALETAGAAAGGGWERKNSMARERVLLCCCCTFQRSPFACTLPELLRLAGRLLRDETAGTLRWLLGRLYGRVRRTKSLPWLPSPFAALCACTSTTSAFSSASCWALLSATALPAFLPALQGRHGRPGVGPGHSSPTWPPAVCACLASKRFLSACCMYYRAVLRNSSIHGVFSPVAAGAGGGRDDACGGGLRGHWENPSAFPSISSWHATTWAAAGRLGALAEASGGRAAGGSRRVWRGRRLNAYAAADI